uniref:Uncharacterized protein n=1 Tax=Timspurckia oligopyrenoides TaxID=708627 RepID=A0A7S0ZL14_9RHOD|mmetsp:Transcript_9347/g.16844  ORF Transcript_9347/g.16844 Transcript_9347/m.16844 type:complete len:242 (+) Transcript_9347:12-737(+)
MAKKINRRRGWSGGGSTGKARGGVRKLKDTDESYSRPGKRRSKDLNRPIPGKALESFDGERLPRKMRRIEQMRQYANQENDEGTIRVKRSREDTGKIVSDTKEKSARLTRSDKLSDERKKERELKIRNELSESAKRVNGESWVEYESRIQREAANATVRVLREAQGIRPKRKEYLRNRKLKQNLKKRNVRKGTLDGDDDDEEDADSDHDVSVQLLRKIATAPAFGEQAQRPPERLVAPRRR